MTRFLQEEMQTLPHWARVAFAAHCGRAVEPIFRISWPDASAERVEKFRLAIHLAEQSAAQGKAVEGLRNAMIDAVATAGAALRRVYGFPLTEPTPTGEDGCIAACLCAKVAEGAAKAAQRAATESVTAALDAYAFARDVANNAKNEAILDRLEGDFSGLRRVAALGRWTDETPVPPSVFGLL